MKNIYGVEPIINKKAEKTSVKQGFIGEVYGGNYEQEVRGQDVVGEIFEYMIEEGDLDYGTDIIAFQFTKKGGTKRVYGTEILGGNIECIDVGVRLLRIDEFGGNIYRLVLGTDDGFHEFYYRGKEPAMRAFSLMEGIKIPPSTMIKHKNNEISRVDILEKIAKLFKTKAKQQSLYKVFSLK